MSGYGDTVLSTDDCFCYILYETYILYRTGVNTQLSPQYTVAYHDSTPEYCNLYDMCAVEIS